MQFTEEDKMRLWIGESNATFDKWGNSTLYIIESIDIPKSYQEFWAMLEQGLWDAGLSYYARA